LWFGLLVKYLSVDGLVLFSSLHKFVYFMWQKPWELLDVMFRVVSIMFSFLSIKMYVCTWVDLLFVNKKKVFKEDERALENFDKHDVIKSNITHILRILLICQNGVEQLWRSFQGPWQGSCPWIKQCIHFENLWKYQIFVAWLLKSSLGEYSQDSCFWPKQCIHFEDSWTH